MAVATMRVPTIFTAVDRFSDVVSRMSSRLNNFGNTASSAISRVDHRLNGMWGSMNSMSQLAIGGGIGGLFYYAGKDIMEYEKKIASLAAVTGTKIGSMNKQIESLGRDTKRSVIDIAGSFEIVGSKMSEYLDNPEALRKITKAGIMLADASRMELEPSLDALTQTMNIYKLRAEDAERIVNKLSAGETVGSISISQSADILRQFGSQAVSTNVRIEESIALIQTLTKSMGVEGVGRNLRNILFDISAPATWDKRKWAAIKMVGADFKIISNEALSFRERLSELQKLAKNNDALGLFFKRTGTVGAKTLFQNIDVYDRFIGKIDKLNDAQEKAAKNSSTLSWLMGRLKDSFANFVVTGEQANGALGVVKSLMRWMIDNMGSLVNIVMSVTVAFLGWKAIVGVVALINGVMATFNAIMAAHRFIVLWATMTNVSYAASLWAVAAATLAAYWPLLLIAGALGVLVYSMWDTRSATDAMVGGQISSLDKGNQAWMNSTNIMESQLNKQKRLLSGNKPAIPPVAVAKGVLANVSQRKAENEARIKALPPMMNMSSKLFDENKTPIKVSNPNAEAYSEKPKNLAGTNMLTESKMMELMNSRGGTLDINLNVPPDYSMDVDAKNMKGIDVKTTPNQGYRGR